MPHEKTVHTRGQGMSEQRIIEVTIKDAFVMAPSYNPETQFKILFENNPLPTFLYDIETFYILAVNEAAIRHYGYSREEFLALTLKEIRPAEDLALFLDKVAKVHAGEDTVSRGIRHKKKDGTIFYVEITARAFFYSGRIAELVIANDITERLQLEQEREELICELQKSLEQVRTLKGLLPICAACKSIRDDEGYWNQIEVYIREHSEAQFTHSMCPGCAKQLYPEIYSEVYPVG